MTWTLCSFSNCYYRSVIQQNLGSMATLEYLTIQTSRNIGMPLRHSVDKVQVMDIDGNLHLPESFQDLMLFFFMMAS